MPSLLFLKLFRSAMQWWRGRSTFFAPFRVFAKREWVMSCAKLSIVGLNRRYLGDLLLLLPSGN